MISRAATCLSLLLLLSLRGAADAQPDKTAAMTPVKYERLKAEVLKQRGKVVVVDFWAGY
jgi:hypothetical protein